MKVYLASAYAERERLNKVREAIEPLGFEVTSRWLTGSHEMVDNPTIDDEVRLNRRFAMEDLQDVKSADILVHFTPIGTNKGRGGRHVEFGIALGLGKVIVHVGPSENVFHFLPGVYHIEHDAALIHMFETARIALTVIKAVKENES